MTARFDCLKATRLANELAAELAKLAEVPHKIQKGGDVLSMTKFCLPALARCFEHGVYEGLEPGNDLPAWLKD
jgi:hypothetical protein